MIEDEFPLRVTITGPEHTDFRWGAWMREIKEYMDIDLNLSNSRWMWGPPSGAHRDQWDFYFREENTPEAVQFKLRWG